MKSVPSYIFTHGSKSSTLAYASNAIDSQVAIMATRREYTPKKAADTAPAPTLKYKPISIYIFTTTM